MKRMLPFVLLCLFLLASCQSQPAVNDPQPAATEAPAEVVVTGPNETEPPAAELVPTEAVVTEAVATEAAAVEPAPTQQPEVEAADSASNQPPRDGDVLDEIIAAMQTVFDVESFRVDQTVISPDMTTEQQIEVVMPDRYHMVSTDMELIEIGDQAYILVDGEWMQWRGMADMVISTFMMFTNEDDGDVFRTYAADAEFLGTEDLEGEQVRAYQYRINDDEGASSLVKLWIAESDGLPRRMEIDITGASPEDDAQIINVYKDYNAEITIEPPQ